MARDELHVVDEEVAGEQSEACQRRRVFNALFAVTVFILVIQLPIYHVLVVI